MAWGKVTVAGFELRETTSAARDGDSLRIRGQESYPPSTKPYVEAADGNLVALGKEANERDLIVPVTFTDKTWLTGFYRVASASSELDRRQNGAVEVADWQLSLERVGTAPDVEIESLLPMIGRTDELAGTQTPSFWHAPAVGHTSYLTGATVPAGTLTRTSSDGVLTVYTGIPAGYAPRWTVAAADYLLGSARVLFDGIRRLGRSTPLLSVWEVHNGLVRVVSGAGGSFTVSCWDAGAWRSAKSYAVTVNGAALTSQPELTVLRNDPEEVVVRLTYPGSPGRTTVDLSLRRGARFVTGTIKRHSAATIGVARTAAEAASVVTGGLRATSADADGNRFVLGSSRLVTTATGTASISKASVTRFDFFAGHEVDEAPQAGDAFADLLAQYLAAGGELATVVTR